ASKYSGWCQGPPAASRPDTAGDRRHDTIRSSPSASELANKLLKCLVTRTHSGKADPTVVSEFLESRAQNFLLLVLFLLFELPSRRISEGLAERSRRKMKMKMKKKKKKKKKKKTEKTEQKKGRRIHWEERINSGKGRVEGGK
ncbi:hypothetical protein ALC56_04663, partial [Trachymyrmex septentrionalis]